VDAELEGREETTATENQNDAETTTNTSQDQVTLIAAAKDRTTQDDDQLFTCLMESITKAAWNTVNLKKDEFTIGGENSGILLLKIIIAKSQVDGKIVLWDGGHHGHPQQQYYGLQCGN
jgi:hypothetical protein